MSLLEDLKVQNALIMHSSRIGSMPTQPHNSTIIGIVVTHTLALFRHFRTILLNLVILCLFKQQ